MEKSETIGKLSLALSKVQSQLRPAKENSKNPFFKSSYADLGSVWDSVRKLLADNELAIIQMPTDIGGVTPGDDITFSPSVLGRNTLPDSVFLLKQSDSEFKLSGLYFSLM